MAECGTCGLTEFLGSCHANNRWLYSCSLSMKLWILKRQAVSRIRDVDLASVGLWIHFKIGGLVGCLPSGSAGRTVC